MLLAQSEQFYKGLIRNRQFLSSRAYSEIFNLISVLSTLIYARISAVALTQLASGVWTGWSRDDRFSISQTSFQLFDVVINGLHRLSRRAYSRLIFTSRVHNCLVSWLVVDQAIWRIVNITEISFTAIKAKEPGRGIDVERKYSRTGRPEVLRLVNTTPDRFAAWEITDSGDSAIRRPNPLFLVPAKKTILA